MDIKKLQASIEAVLFAHAEPLSAQKLAELLEVEAGTVERLLLAIRDTCEDGCRGVQLLQLEGAWQFSTKAEHGELVKKALDNRRNTPLTPAALEVLAVIAYNQPVSRSFIEQVRGVDSSSTVANLVEKGLVAEAGRLDLPGRPVAFKTTDAFLRSFGLQSLSALPALHSEDTQADESGLYQMPEGVQPEAWDGEGQETPTRALRGGNFIEGEGGQAEYIGESE